MTSLTAHFVIDFQYDRAHASSMLEMNSTMKQARGMIGARLRHGGHNCTVIEVLEDQLELILEADNASLEIQADAYGNARREMRALYYIPIFNTERDDIHPSFLSLVGQ